MGKERVAIASAFVIDTAIAAAFSSSTINFLEPFPLGAIAKTCCRTLASCSVTSLTRKDGSTFAEYQGGFVDFLAVTNPVLSFSLWDTAISSREVVSSKEGIQYNDERKIWLSRSSQSSVRLRYPPPREEPHRPWLPARPVSDPSANDRSVAKCHWPGYLANCLSDRR